MTVRTLAQQVTKLYELIAGYHATHLLEIGRELGVWEAITASPGIASEALTRRLVTDPFYTDVLRRTAFAFELQALCRDAACGSARRRPSLASTSRSR